MESYQQMNTKTAKTRLDQRLVQKLSRLVKKVKRIKPKLRRLEQDFRFWRRRLPFHLEQWRIARSYATFDVAATL